MLTKRDDLLGPGLGGNKARKLEYLLGAALRDGAQVIISTGEAQSNHCRVIAAAAGQLGLQVHLLLKGEPGAPRTGNLLLDGLFGARIEFFSTGSWSDASRRMDEIAREYEGAGKHAYVINAFEEAAAALGAVGYAGCVLELMSQLFATHQRATHLVSAAGSGGTLAGLALGARLFHADFHIVGVTIRESPEWLRRTVPAIANAAAELIGTGVRISADDFSIVEGYVGTAYPDPSPEGAEAIQQLARTEGILLDPTYTGKALAGVIGEARRGHLTGDDTVVFLHTGGLPGLFAAEGRRDA